MSSVNAPPAAPCLRPSVAPFELGDLPLFELPASVSVEVCSVDSSVSTCTRATEAERAITEVPPSAPHFRPSSPPFDLGILPPFRLPASCELPHTSETSTVESPSTSPRQASAVLRGHSARFSSVGEIHLVPPSAPLLKPVAFVGETNSEEMPSLELPPPALGLSGGPRLRPSADPFDLKDLLPLELPSAVPEMPPLAAASSPSSSESQSEEVNALETTGHPDGIVWYGMEWQFTSCDELPNLCSTGVMDRHGGFMKCDAGSMRGRSSLRSQASREDNLALRQMTGLRCDVSFSRSAFPLSLKHQREMSPSTASTNASDIG
eukprot:TRINITY_DN19301_c0_g1_i3.p1 TRINITY_DN19301_c0_g1~~TRINITY_DN19301_c0_g1_i3.p1  ORF type:complete len:321 (-),score=41.60 TRINITY_DN19301_c0_g1_i3:101-1063(-)